jgi:hypothetical protein
VSEAMARDNPGMYGAGKMPGTALAQGATAGGPVLGYLVSGRTAHAVRGNGPALLPFGATGYAVSRPPGSTRLLVLLPSGVQLRVGDDQWLHTAALVEHGQTLTLMTREPPARVAPEDASGSGEAPASGEAPGTGREREAGLVFRAFALVVAAGEVGAARCGMCFAQLAGSDRVRICPACRAVLCTQCASAGQCIACGEALGGGRA